MASKILIIDDNEADNFLHKRMLKKACYKGDVEVYKDPEQGYQKIVEEVCIGESSQIILLDINMPGLTGWDILEKLDNPKLESQIEKCDIYMMSTSSNPDDRAKAVGNKIVKGFINKPLTVDKLQKIIAAR